MAPARTKLVDPRALAVPFAFLAAAAFVVAQPPVGDFWAARARQSAVLDGVGLDYWFGWFGGIVPGHYSVLLPLLVRVLDPALLGAISTAISVVLCRRLVRGSRHATLATWLAAVAASASLWSGRVPFAVATSLMLLGLLCVRERRTALGAVAGVLTALASPVSGAFLALGLVGVALHDRDRRTTAVATAGCAAATLVGIGLYFGHPGPQEFPLVAALLCCTALVAMLVARPAPVVRTVIVLALLACPVVALVGNGLGSNLERLVWLYLPVATAATGRARMRVVVLATCFALTCALFGSARDLWVAAQPMSDPRYTDGLVAELERTPGLDSYRVEVVPDGTHVAAYTLLEHASLARGFETQSDHALNAVLYSDELDATSYREWLDENAVGYVALGGRTLRAGHEDDLVRSGDLPYLKLVWSDTDWSLFQVQDARPIVDPPAHVVEATQSQLRLYVPTAGWLSVQVRWSRFLRAYGTGFWPGVVAPDQDGWTRIYVPVPGTYLLTG